VTEADFTGLATEKTREWIAAGQSPFGAVSGSARPWVGRTDPHADNVVIRGG
jgi:hypothetical protein